MPFVRVTPAPRELNRSLDGFDAGVHRHGLIVAADARELFEEARHAIVAQRARGKRNALALLDERRVDARVAVADVYRRIGADAVEIPLTADVPKPSSLGPLDDDVERRVVTGAVALLVTRSGRALAPRGDTRQTC